MRSQASRIGTVFWLVAGVAACTGGGTRHVEPGPDAGVDAAVPPGEPKQECPGEDVASSLLPTELAFDAQTGEAVVTVTNNDDAARLIEVVLHTRDPRGGLASTSASPVLVMPGQFGTVRIVVGDVTGDLPTHLKAEIVARDEGGALVDRAFAQRDVGISVSDSAARLGLEVSSQIDGDPVQLGGIVYGGPGVNPSTFDANDATDEVLPPPVPPPALSYNMCFRWPVTLVDAGFGEDYGVSPTSPWIARGGRVSIVQGGQQLFDGYLDASGCTGPFAANGSTNFSIFGYSRAHVGDNDLVIRDDAGKTRSFVIWDADPGLDQTPTYVFPEVEEVSTMLAVSAYTMQKFHAGVTGQTIPVENRCRPVANGCCNCSSDGSLWITAPDRKFVIAHEMGHRILALYMNGFNNDTSFDLIPGNTTGTCDTTTTHSMWSLEYESGAAMEGWAHFISVATFNSREGTNPGAAMRYWSGDGVDVDVEEGPTGGASSYLANVCPGVATATKLSVELDWLRHWWDYYTNATPSDPGYRPTVLEMMQELDAAPIWGAGDAWDQMRLGVQAKSGDTQLSRWDQSGAWNGID